MSNFLEFYRKHNISPVSQSLKDIELHFQRRIGLYRTLGLPPSHFKGLEVLEVAPGSGHNSIVTATFGARSYDLVEPNLAGFNEMLSLFDKYQVKDSSIRFFNNRLEEFAEKKTYDIVLCEGLIPGLSNQDLFIDNLSNKVRSGGILVVTCADAVSVFFESLRRYLARILVAQSGIEFATKGGVAQIVHYLSKIFESHLMFLTGISRPVEDWVWDNLLNPAAASLAASNEFSIEKCLEVLGDRFYFFGSSPTFMADWRWYKTLPGDPREFNEPFLKSFSLQRHNLLNHQEIGFSDASAGERLYHCCKTFASYVEKRDPLSPGYFDAEICRKELNPVVDVLKILSDCGLKDSVAAISEFVYLFNGGRLPTTQSISEMKAFRGAFGKGQQYVSLVRV